MLTAAIEEATRLLIAARHSGDLLATLPPACRPTDTAEAHAIQDATVAALSDAVAGWKIALAPDATVMRGVLLRSRVMASPAHMKAAQVPLLGVEAEIAFHFDRALAPRERDYSHAEVAQAVTAFAAIEVVDTRFTSYANTPPLQRLADFMSNGAFVHGAMQADWRKLDLANLHVRLTLDDKVITERIGGHVTQDPLIPAVALVNELRKQGGVPAGMVMTTGTYTGLNYAKPGQTAVVSFDGFDSVELTFDR